MALVDGIAYGKAVARRIVAAPEQPVDLGLDRPIITGALASLKCPQWYGHCYTVTGAGSPVGVRRLTAFN
ncbi:MAG: hypothetical protein AB4050_06910 [Synechococcus sp.]